MTDAVPHVVIVGGGFGGLETARGLASAPVRMTLVDRRNHHLFQPLLYQVATAGLSAADVAAPIRKLLRRQRNTTVLLAGVTAVDAPGRRLVLDDGTTLAYDTLVLACGATTTWFGHDAWAAHAPGLKSLEDALEIRRRVLLAFEAAEREPSAEARTAWLTFVVVGGGATGVELAGALAEIARHTLARDFRRFDPKTARVVLVEGGPRLLTAFPDALAAEAARALRALGVEVRTGEPVVDVDETGLRVQRDGTVEAIAARTVLWGAGIVAEPLLKTLGAPLDRGGRVLVEPDLSVPGHPEILVLGDAAAVRHTDGAWVPGVAPAAIQGGQYAARLIRHRLRGAPVSAFRYFDKGSLATIGRRKAVAKLGRLHARGVFAWLLWLFVHIMYLAGFRNRLVVLLDWAWAYVTYNRAARIILEDDVSASIRARSAVITRGEEPERGPAEKST